MRVREWEWKCLKCNEDVIIRCCQKFHWSQLWFNFESMTHGNIDLIGGRYIYIQKYNPSNVTQKRKCTLCRIFYDRWRRNTVIAAHVKQVHRRQSPKAKQGQCLCQSCMAVAELVQTTSSSLARDTVSEISCKRIHDAVTWTPQRMSLFVRHWLYSILRW